MTFVKGYVPSEKHRNNLSRALRGREAWNNGKRGVMPTPWNKGKKGLQVGWSKGFTKETNKSVRRIAESKVGKKRLDMIGNQWNKGRRPVNWKGGITSKNRMDRIKFRKYIQKKVFMRDNYTCQICGNREVPLQVDHIQSWANYVELRFNIDNCRTLCQKCHYEITYRKPMSREVKTWGHNLKLLEVNSLKNS